MRITDVVESKWFAGIAATLGIGAVGYTTYKYVFPIVKKLNKPDKSEPTDNIYESTKLLNEYLAFHYGSRDVNCLYPVNVDDGFDFPQRCAQLCIKHSTNVSGTIRAFDIGCAVGGSCFELARTFDEVIGLDYSAGFVRTCDVLKRSGSLMYDVCTEGDLVSKHTAHISDDIHRDRCSFMQGDACNLPLHLGKFDCVLAANLICRLPKPVDFLLRLKSLVRPGGIAVITSPYTFLRNFTSKDQWLGGFVDKQGREVKGFETIGRILSEDFELICEENMPFVIRETARKHQLTFAHATVWKRKKED